MSDLPPPPRAAPAIVNFDAWCNSCGYNLLGLPMAGVCPECAKPVEQSLRGDLLENCEPTHVATLLRGVTFVLNGILAMVAMVVVSVGAAMVSAAAGAGPAPMAVNLVIQMVNLALSGVILYGWWLFSTLDPAYTGRNDASRSRLWIRNLLIVTIPVSIIQMVVGFAAPTVVGLTFAIGAISTAIWVARFFFETSYIRWLAPRLPNEKVARRAKLLLWLGPVLYTVGMLACGLGPLVALVLYWNLLHWIRLDLRTIAERQALGGVDIPRPV